MDTMYLYHGSKTIIKQPQFQCGNPHNDYGLGFYCTENKELAKEWACSNINEDGFVNVYKLNTANLKILNLSDKNYSILNWLAILLKNRTFSTSSPLAVATKEMLIKHFYVPIDEYDVVIGYRADDSYFSFARDFISNSISLDQLENAMKLGKLGEQVALISKKAFDNLVFITHEVVDHREYYTKRVKRDAEARNEYSTLKDTGVINGVYAIDVLREKENG